MEPNFIMKKLEISLLLGFLFFQSSTGIADNAAYYIKNVQDNLCVTGGPIVDADSDSPSIFQSGIVITSNCTGDNNQQWVTQMKNVTNHVPEYNLRSFNSSNYNKQLYVKVRGEFIKFFSDLLEFRPKHYNESRSVYSLYNTQLHKCYASLGENHVLHAEKCDPNNLSQLWNVTIVNQYPAAGTICTSFWSCNQ